MEFCLQYWPFVVLALWSLVSTPPFPVLMMIVVVCNMGGVYNAVVYTVIRRKYTAVVEPTEGQMEAPPPTRSTNINAVE